MLLLVFFILVASISICVSCNEPAESLGVAADNKPFSEAELRSLPPLIEVKLRHYLGERPPQVVKVVDENIRKYGWGFNGLHHYGMGLIYLKRVANGDANRNFLLESAYNEFTFSLKPHAVKTYTKLFCSTFLPENVYKRAETLI